MKKRFLWVLLILLMTGCAVQERAGKETEKEPVTLVLASFGEDAGLQEQVELFNQAHTDYKIEIQQYMRSEQVEEDGINKLQREIVSGNGPDLINYGRGYLVTDIIGEYTENLFPYLEETQADYFSNIWDAFSYQDGLYAMPVDFTLSTYVARRSVAGDRKSWTIEELIACYEEEYEKAGGSFMLYPGETKKDVFGSLITGNVGNYVDWENGTCNFAGDDFKTLLEFANRFPDTLNITEDFSPMQTFADGKALMLPLSVNSVYDVCNPELLLKEDAAFIGFPTEGTDGTVIKPGALMLAISSVSKHKEAAWEFIGQFLAEEYQENLTSGLPVRRSALEKQLLAAMTIEYTEDAEGNPIPKEKSKILFEGEEPIIIYQITEEQRDALWDIVESASVGSSYDVFLHTILLEEADGYFSGDKTLEEVIELIQGRARVYIGENS